MINLAQLSEKKLAHRTAKSLSIVISIENKIVTLKYKWDNL